MRGGGGGGGCSIEPVRCGDGRGSISACLGVGWEGCSHRTKERVNVRVTPRVHGAPFFVRSSLYFFRCDAQILEARPQNAHEPLMGIYCRLHPHECMHVQCSAVQGTPLGPGGINPNQ